MLTIIICTHNRASLLHYCLDSLLAQTMDQKLFEVLVVDNASTDNTPQVIVSYIGQFESLRYVFDPIIGLSQARNTGFHRSKYNWVAYLDDDAKAHPDFVERILKVIKEYPFDCFGGRFLPWYIRPKPAWLPNDFGLFPMLKIEIAEIDRSQHVPGGVIIFRKSVLGEIGGFPLNLGMVGNQVGYGEENWVQDQIRKLGYRVGFDPELKIDHLVADYKYKMGWHLRRMFAKGKMERIMAVRKPGISYRVGLFFRAIISGIFGLIKNSIKLFTRNDYYIQNYILESVGNIFKVMGYLSVK